MMKNKRIACVLILSLAMLMLTACGQKNAEKNPAVQNDQAAPETEAPETEAPETEAPETEAPETEAPETEAPETEATIADSTSDELPQQGEVPCNFNDVLDLSADMLATELVLEDSAGSWILGDDANLMQTPITEELLNEYKYFAFTYECYDCDSDSELALMFKYVHEDGTKTEFLSSTWFPWGPAGMTYYASTFYTMNVYGEEGVFYVPTEVFLSHEEFRAGDIINLMGLCGVEDTGTWVEVSITGAYLTK